jgi:uncharacterized membrane protein
MDLNLALPRTLHQLASIVWIGGMFFAHFALRPTLKSCLALEARVEVAHEVFRRFFPWVWASIVTVWVSGFWIAFIAYGSHVALHVHVMMGLALVMTLIFIYLFAVPYRRLRSAMDQDNWRRAGTEASRVRKWMAVNLALGIATVLVASAGPLVIPSIAALTN